MDFDQLNELSVGPHALDNGMFLLAEEKEKMLENLWWNRGFVISDYQDYLEKIGFIHGE